MKQCDNCIRKGLRDCMYHGYPEETIPDSCTYKIGNAAVYAVYDVPVAVRKDTESKYTRETDYPKIVSKSSTRISQISPKEMKRIMSTKTTRTLKEIRKSGDH